MRSRVQEGPDEFNSNDNQLTTRRRSWTHRRSCIGNVSILVPVSETSSASITLAITGTNVQAKGMRRSLVRVIIDLALHCPDVRVWRCGMSSTVRERLN